MRSRSQAPRVARSIPLLLALVAGLLAGLGIGVGVALAGDGPHPVTAHRELAEPVAGLAAASSEPTVWGYPTVFTATVSGGTDVVLQFDFGDGTPAVAIPRVAAVVSHTYASPGRYVATVTATNGVNAVSASAPVEVAAPTSLDLVEFGDAGAGNFWATWSLAMLAVSAGSLLGLLILWRMGWLFPRRP